MLVLNDSKTVLEGDLKLSDGERHNIVKWLSGAPQASFFIGDDDSIKREIQSYISGDQYCFIELHEYLEYLAKVKVIINRYASMYHGPTSTIDDVIARFSTMAPADAKIILSYAAGDRYIRILNDKKGFADNCALYGEEVLKNGTAFRNSFVGGITKITITKENGTYRICMKVIDEWRDVLMQENGKKVTLESIVNIYNEEMNINTSAGKTNEEAAQIFGIKYGPLLEGNSHKFTYIDVVNNSSFNSLAIQDAVKNGMALSSAVLWETKDSSEDDDSIFKHNVYGIHIKKMNDALDSLNPHICIGWSSLGDLSGISTKADLNSLYSSVWPAANAKAKGQDVGQIWRFIKESQVGDYVIFAEPTVCHIGKIISDYEYDAASRPTQDTDYVNSKKVEWLLKDIARNTLSLRMHKSLSTSMSFWRLNDYKSAVADLLAGAYEADEEDTSTSTTIDGVVYKTNISSTYSRNRIVFGAPGTGKSYLLNKEKDILLANGGEYERVTFHPDYTYANFVGTYKPVPESGTITYKYVPGPFMRLYVKALKNAKTFNPQPHLLLIEEINRAKVAAVFGEVFQLLDRDDDEISSYPIQTTEDMRDYLVSELGGNKEDYAEIKIPDNMFIWASMNSADQGVFPMDTAFKRRWDFKYIGIDNNEDGIKDRYVKLGSGSKERLVEWNELRKEINAFLADTCKINEDKLLGPYFISKKIIDNYVEVSGKKIIDATQFIDVFKSKVIMYLFEDAAKQKRPTLFGGLTNSSKYSDVIKAFDSDGVDIFADSIRVKFPLEETEDAE